MYKKWSKCQIEVMKQLNYKFDAIDNYILVDRKNYDA